MASDTSKAEHRGTVYASSPGNQMTYSYHAGLPVLQSFGLWAPWMWDYIKTVCPLLGDSGAYSVLNSGKTVDIEAFEQWSQDIATLPNFWACAALDDIAGDSKKSIANWDRHPWCFPTLHDTDDEWYVDALRERFADSDRPRIIGVGIKPMKRGERTYRPPKTFKRVIHTAHTRLPPDLHIHGFAGGGVSGALAATGRPWSTDSVTLVFKMAAKTIPTEHLTRAEVYELNVKISQRAQAERHANAAARDAASRRQTELFSV